MTALIAAKAEPATRDGDGETCVARWCGVVVVALPPQWQARNALRRDDGTAFAYTSALVVEGDRAVAACLHGNNCQ